jgi:hypothetical protein
VLQYELGLERARALGFCRLCGHLSATCVNQSAIIRMSIGLQCWNQDGLSYEIQLVTI